MTREERKTRKLTTSPQTLRPNIAFLPPAEVALHIPLKVVLGSSDQTPIVGDVEPRVKFLVKIASCAAYDDAAVWPGDQVVVFVVRETHHVAFGQCRCAFWYEACDHAFDGDDLAFHFWDECGGVAVGSMDDGVASY